MTRPARPRRKILCIDDDPAITTAIRLRLLRYDVEVVAAADGTDGISLAMSDPPDVIIIDLRIAFGDGDFAAECLRQRAETRAIPLIALTEQRSEFVARRLESMGIDQCLLKPLQIESLMMALASYIELRPNDRDEREFGFGVW
jgi:CheY-like chemotaxis protein